MSISEEFRVLRRRRARRVRQARIVKLSRRAKRIEKQLAAPGDADTERGEAEAQLKNFGSGKEKWKAWGALLEAHRRCDLRVRAFARAASLLRKAKRLDLSTQETRDLASSFRRVASQTDEVALLEVEIQEAGEAWKDERDFLEKEIPGIFLVHAFLRVSELGRVEVATLCTAALVWFGIVYSEAFYFGAIGTGVLRYVTVEDFLDQGVRGVLPLACFLIAVEVAFVLLRWILSESARLPHKWCYKPHRLILDHPGWTATWTFLVITLAMASMGLVHGGVRRVDAFATKASGLESATVMGGTTLRHVYMVGTTSRTAAFLQVCSWEKDRQFGLEEVHVGIFGPVVALRKTLDRVGREVGKAVEGSVGPGGKVKAGWGVVAGLVPELEACPKDAEEETWEYPVRGRVLIMDRALVICHAVGDVCTDQEGTAVDGETQAALDSLSERLDGIGRQLELRGVRELVDQRLEDHVEEIDARLNRHRCQIVEHIDSLRSSGGGG